MSQKVSNKFPFENCIICNSYWPKSALTKEGICPDCLIIGRGEEYEF
jgi:hypothetical protein